MTRKYQTYRVIWEIDMDAKTPEEAAAKALIVQRDNDPMNAAVIFDCIDEDGESHRVDLFGADVEVDASNAKPKRRIWTVTTNDDSGVETKIYLSEKDAEHAAIEWLKSYWDFCKHGKITDWQEAYEQLCEQPMFMDSIAVQEHTITEEKPNDRH